MNLTIVSLRASNQFSVSPLVSTQMNLHISKSMFSHHFSSILYARKALTAEKTRFSHSLNSAIVLDSIQRSGKVFTSTESFGEDIEYTITSCAFYKCTSTSGSGAIKCSKLPATSTFTIEKTGFDSCSGTTGGAFELSTQKINLNNCCFRSCTATTSMAAFKCEATKEFNINQLLVTKCHGSGTLYASCKSVALYKAPNITNNQDTKEMATFIGDNFALQYSTLADNDVNIVLYPLATSSPQMAQLTNFIRNVGKYSITITDQFTFHQVSFIDEKTSFAVKNDKGSYCQFRDVVTTVTKLDATFFTQVICANPTTGKAITQSIIPNNEECWALIPSNDTSTGMSWKIKALIIVSVILLILVLVFIYRKTCGNKYGLSGQRLAYTL